VIGRLNAFEVVERGSSAAEVVDVEVALSPHAKQARMLRRGEQRGADIDIEDADVLVAGGRGLGAAAGFELCTALAEALGGASRRRARSSTAGLYPYAAQIGQTGQDGGAEAVPRVGVSGAIQHKVGMQGSENIVAINKDANAPIFDFSDLGGRRRSQQDPAEADRGREGQEELRR